MTSLALITENAFRGLRTAEGRITIATTTTLLFFLITLSLTSASIQRYLSDNLDQMLGSDLVIEGHSSIGEKDIAFIRSVAREVSIAKLHEITLVHQDRWARLNLKLVDDAYPLRGKLLVGATPEEEPGAVSRGPALNEIWLDARLAVQLHVNVGDVLRIGDRALKFSAILLHEPDRLMEGHSTAMRAMAHVKSLESVDENSAIARTRYLIDGDETQIGAIETWAGEALRGVRVIRRSSGEHPLASFWRRAENFLGMASVVLFLMGAVAIDMTNRRWLSTMRYRLSLYASFGVTPLCSMLIAVGEWLIGFIASLLLAGGLAALAYGMIVTYLQNYFPGLLALWHWSPVLKTAALLAILLVALQIPSFVQLSRASLLSLIRNPTHEGKVWHRFLWSFSSVALLAAVYSDNWTLTAMTLAAIAAALFLIVALTWVLVSLGESLGRQRAGLLPLAFFLMRRRLVAKSAQAVGFGLSALLLLLSLMLMRDLRSTMESHKRTHDGNLMIADAQADQIGSITRWASDTRSSIRALRPFVPAQLVAVNGMSLTDFVRQPSETLASLRDPIRLSWSDQVPSNNRITGGTWWSEGTRNWQQISAESEVMADIGLRYGDVLTYQINGKPYEFTLVASHDIKSGGSSITFWFQVPPSAKARIGAPVHYMGSMELPESAWNALGDLWRQHSTLSLVPLRELTARFDQALGIVTKLTAGYSVMVLLLAIFVFAASMLSVSANDRQRNGLLRSMGLKNSECLRLSLYDWGATAIIAASGALLGTYVAGLLIYRSQFSLIYEPDLLWLLTSGVVLQLAVCLVGYIACRKTLAVSAKDLLTS